VEETDSVAELDSVEVSAFQLHPLPAATVADSLDSEGAAAPEA